ncbi:phosphatase PAP2 family protein [Microbacteriaceae bacterium VKM Ac-2855]|nr:phosphatase PAP2 family protein [Microbacteriaceae bacterium VKM Ac-2855]
MALRGTRTLLVLLRRLSRVPEPVRRVDKAVGRRINRRAVHPSIDGFFVGLTRFADRGVLWFVLAALLVLAGRPREAARGLGSLMVASTAANLIGKRLFGGTRPLTVGVPVGRRLAHVPTSPTFPSGHSASAAAFVTGVALESPRVGAVLAPVALGVGYSRLHVGVHWLSDVLGGAAVGAGVAVAGRMLVPARPRVAAVEERASRAPAEPAPLDRGAGLFVIVNPNAGRDSHRPDPLPILAAELPEAAVHPLAEGDDLTALVSAALAGSHPPTALGIYAGDGTTARVAGIARSHGLDLVVFPGGTMNHFAKALGLPAVEDAIAAVRRGVRRDVDVAELVVGDQTITVLNTVSIGVYPEFVERRERREGRIGKPLAAVVSAIEAVRGSEPVDLEFEGRRIRVWSYFVGVGREHPHSATPLARRRLDGGLLEVRILHANRQPRTRGAVSLVLGRFATPVVSRLPGWGDAPVVESAETAEQSIRVRGADGGDPGFAHDGEAAEAIPGAPDADGFRAVTVRVVPAGLRVYSAD